MIQSQSTQTAQGRELTTVPLVDGRVMGDEPTGDVKAGLSQFEDDEVDCDVGRKARGENDNVRQVVPCLLCGYTNALLYY